MGSLCCSQAVICWKIEVNLKISTFNSIVFSNSDAILILWCMVFVTHTVLGHF